MSLIINQGNQPLDEDRTYEVMISPNEIAQITKIEMDKNWDNTLNITFKVISEGNFKGRLFWDRVSFDPKSEYSWKYRNLRKSAGVPYTQEESDKIDIEGILLNKAVTVELTSRKGNDGNEYQSVKYKTSNATAQAPVENTEELSEDEESIDVTTDEQVPW